MPLVNSYDSHRFCILKIYIFGAIIKKQITGNNFPKRRRTKNGIKQQRNCFFEKSISKH